MEGEAGTEKRWPRRTTSLFVSIEHFLYMVLAALLVVTCGVGLAGAGLTLIHGVSDWTQTKSVFEVIDRLLVVLMLVEILHTVLASVRSGTLTCEPFLIVGLIASIRRMLVITLESTQAKPQTDLAMHAIVFRDSMIELGVLGGLILVMVISIYALRQSRTRPGTPP
ncbi:MAG: phosphate-starvation-inducible PsiE family protein [Acetobacteraceae bacterium]|nr:phosphate-starvation-inducible PsiE family protein [Pseudomonadota bacterium]